MLSDYTERKFELKIDRELDSKSKKNKLFDGFKGNKVVNEVLDKSTILALYHLIKTNTISYVNGAVKAGKESVLFWAVDGQKNDIALKIYLISTSNFKKRMPYIAGDPRFSRIKKGTKNLVNLWAKKEFRNLQQCYDCGIPVVKPLFLRKNILGLKFIGHGGVPEKTLLESEVDKTDYKSAINLISLLYKKAKLVHGDFSEFNIFKTANGLVIFDLGSAVDLNHPQAIEFLKRDINNISKFFVKRGLTVKNPADIMEEITNEL